MHTQADLVKNLMRCNRFESCNRNQCPLDYELDLRVGGAACLYMQEGSGEPRPMGTGKGIITFVTGAQMPDDLLVHVPAENVSRLNARSKARWDTLSESREAAKSSPPTGENELGEPSIDSGILSNGAGE